MNKQLGRFTLFIIFSIQLVFAGNFGKIIGYVTDNETDLPLVGVNILIEGTNMGSATNADGDYVILQVPPGIYDVSADYIGYAKVITRKVRVSADLTTKLDFGMRPEAIEGELVTVVAERPLFERSATNEVRVVRSEQIQNMPVRGYNSVAALQTGVVMDDNEELHVRGGRRDETAFYIDGVYTNNPYNLSRSGEIPNISMEELSMQIGGFGAEYGDANAGIVNITTKTGSDRMEFSSEAITDAFLSSTPSTLNEKPLAFSYGYNLLSGSLGGPVPMFNFIRFYSALEYLSMDDADPTSGYFPEYTGGLLLNGMPNNGEPFVDTNGNTIYDVGESFTDLDGDGIFDASDYLNVDIDDVSFKYGPKNGNWNNRISFNGNVLIDLNKLTGLAWKLKVGGNYYGEKRSDYLHARSLFAYYNDASSANSVGTDGNLLHRYNISEDLTKTMYAQLRGNIPGIENMFFYLQVSKFSDSYLYYDPVLKKGEGTFLYDDGTISDVEVPYIQYGKVTDYSGIPEWHYYDRDWVFWDEDSNEVIYDFYTFDTTNNIFNNDTTLISFLRIDSTDFTSSYWVLEDTQYVFNRIDYGDTSWINPLYSTVGTLPMPLEEWAYYTIAGYNSSRYEKRETGHIGYKGSLTWQKGKHELKTGFEYRDNTVRYYRIAAGERLSRYFHNIPPYSSDQDRWAYVDTLDALVENNSDGILDYLQDDTDSWDGEDVNGDGSVDYDDYFDDYIFQGFKYSYAENIGYDITGEKKLDSGINGARKPLIGAFYLQDKVELDDLIMTLGLRYDYIDPANKIFNPKTGGNQNITITDAGTIAETVYWKDIDNDGEKDPREYTELNPTSVDSVGLSQQIPAEARTMWSPRIGFAFPVTDKTVFHAQYGKYLQQPELNRMFISYTRFLSNLQQGNYTTSANPEIQPVNTTAYEIGFKQFITPDVSVDATLFYKQMSGYIQIRNISARPTSYAIYVNGDYGTVKGLSFSLHTKRINNWQVDANYTLQYAGGTGSNSSRQYSIAWLSGNFPTFVSPLEYDQRHTGNLTVDYRTGSRGILRNFGVNVLFQFGSGFRYTPSNPRSEVFGGSLAYHPIAALNSGVAPWTFQCDLRVDKSFRVGPTNLSVFLWVQNALDRENIASVYNSTGLPNNDGYLTIPGGMAWLDGVAVGGSAFGSDLYESRINNPYNYSKPRIIRLGVRLDL